ncbi:MAG: hypothetical protein ABI592_08475 [Acidobacteriota bacterium]
MRRFGFGLLFGLAGFALAAVASYFLVQQFSANQHDRSVEAGMTSVFFFGPLGGAAGFVAGLIRGGRRGMAARPPAA